MMYEALSGTIGFVLGAIVAGAICFRIGEDLGMRDGRHESRVEAVENHHARWVTSVEGKSTFEWVDKGGESP